MRRQVAEPRKQLSVAIGFCDLADIGAANRYFLFQPEAFPVALAAPHE
jgi:hypothetical protein